MLLRLLFATILLAHLPAFAQAQYHISIRAFAGGTQGHIPGFDTLKYEFRPEVSLFDEVAPLTYQPSTAYLTMTSSTSVISGYDNHPLGTTASFGSFASSSDLVSEVHGTWNLTIEDAGNTYAYEADVTFALPFAELPSLTSARLVNGNQVGEFDWAIQGGDVTYPGGSNQLFAVSLNTLAFQQLAAAFLPAPTSTWTPPVSLASDQDFLGRVATFQVASDSGSLQVIGIRSLTPGAPELTFGSTSVEYTASLTARLTPLAVPEPASAVTALMATAAIAWGVRRSKRSH